MIRALGWWPLAAMYAGGLLSGFLYLRMWACP